MLPNKETKFLPLSQIGEYLDEKEYFCYSITFDPSEQKLFSDCPPYIQICSENDFDFNLYFEIPKIIAYYAVEHAGYTFKGRDNMIEQGRRQIKNELKDLFK